MEGKRISESLDDSTSRDDTAAVFEKSQTRFRLSQQGVAQLTQAAGTSTGVNVTLPNPSDEPVIASLIPNVCNTGGIFPESKMDPTEKKKLKDRAYRARKRLEKEKMEYELRMVGKENEDLKRENERLRSEKDQGLEASAAEIQRLKTEVCGLRATISHLQVLLDAYSHKLKMESDLRMDGKENEDLKGENEQLRSEKDQGLHPSGEVNQYLTWSNKQHPKSLPNLKSASLKGRKSNLLRGKIRKLREEMAEIIEEQRSIREGKIKVRERFEENQLQHEKLREKTELSAKSFQILRRRKKEGMISLSREEMAEISEERRSIREGQMKVRERFEEKQPEDSESEKLWEETEIIEKQRKNIQMRLDLMFQLVKARAQNDSALVARLISSLRDLMSKQNNENYLEDL